MTDFGVHSTLPCYQALDPLMSFPGIQEMIERGQNKEKKDDRIDLYKHILLREQVIPLVHFDFDFKIKDEESERVGALTMIIRRHWDEVCFRVHMEQSLYLSFIAHAIFDFDEEGIPVVMPTGYLAEIFPSKTIEFLLQNIALEQGGEEMSEESVSLKLGLDLLRKAFGGSGSAISIPGLDSMKGWPFQGSLEELVGKAGVVRPSTFCRSVRDAGVLVTVDGTTYLLKKDVGLVHPMDFSWAWARIQRFLAMKVPGTATRAHREEPLFMTVKQALDGGDISEEIALAFLSECEKRNHVCQDPKNNNKWWWIFRVWDSTGDPFEDLRPPKPAPQDSPRTVVVAKEGESDSGGIHILPSDEKLPFAESTVARLRQILEPVRREGEVVQILSVNAWIVEASQKDGGWPFLKEHLPHMAHPWKKLESEGFIRKFYDGHVLGVELSPKGEAFDVVESFEIDPDTSIGRFLHAIVVASQVSDLPCECPRIYELGRSMTTSKGKGRFSDGSVVAWLRTLKNAGYIEDGSQRKPVSVRVLPKALTWFDEHYAGGGKREEYFEQFREPSLCLGNQPFWCYGEGYDYGDWLCEDVTEEVEEFLFVPPWDTDVWGNEGATTVPDPPVLDQEVVWEHSLEAIAGENNDEQRRKMIRDLLCPLPSHVVTQEEANRILKMIDHLLLGTLTISHHVGRLSDSEAEDCLEVRAARATIQEQLQVARKREWNLLQVREVFHTFVIEGYPGVVAWLVHGV